VAGEKLRAARGVLSGGGRRHREKKQDGETHGQGPLSEPTFAQRPAPRIDPDHAGTIRPASSRTTRSSRRARSWLCVAMSAPQPGLPHHLHQHGEHPLRRLGVEVAGGLVREEELRRIGERAAEGHPLLLAPRQFRRPVVGARGEADAPQKLRRPRPCRAGGDAFRQLRQDHVLERGEFGQEMVELVDEAHDAPPRLGPAAVALARHVIAREHHAPRVGGVEKPCYVEERRLPRPGRRDERHRLARRDADRDTAQHLHRARPAPVVGLRHAVEVQRVTHT
jgi:hypothetical protein